MADDQKPRRKRRSALARIVSRMRTRIRRNAKVYRRLERTRRADRGST
jgi:hypothetical protein